MVTVVTDKPIGLWRNRGKDYLRRNWRLLSWMVPQIWPYIVPRICLLKCRKGYACQPFLRENPADVLVIREGAVPQKS